MKRLLLITLLFFISYQINAQGWGQAQKSVPLDRAQGDFFGQSVAMDGDYAVVGSYRDDLTSGDMGSAYVYRKDTNGDWVEHQKLIAPDKRQFDQFGFSVDIDGDYLIVGALGQDYDATNSNFIGAAGAAYIYEKDTDGNWNFVQKLVASQRETTRQLGRCVAISGDYAIVGLDREDFDVSGENEVQNAGAAYIYERNTSGVWSETQKIVASERSAFDYFGYNGIDIDGNYAVVGAMQEDEDENGVNEILSAGGAYIFERDTNGVWNEIQKVVASDRAQGDYFGWSIAIDGDHLIVGSNQDNNFTGAGYVFEKSGSGIWNQVQKLTASNALIGDRFGQDIDIDGNRIIVGAHFKDIGSPGDDGAAYIFEYQAGVWNETAFIYDTFNETSEYFGYSVAISGDYALVGAYQDGDDENEENYMQSAGAAFIFDANEPNTLSVIETDFSETIKAYPNPTHTKLHIELKEVYTHVEVIVTNILGQNVSKQEYHNLSKIQLDLRDYVNGLYLIRFKLDNGSVKTIKVIKA